VVPLKVEVFCAPGCRRCTQAAERLRALIADLGDDRIHWREVDVVGELDYAVALGVLSTPAIAIDGVLVYPSHMNRSCFEGVPRAPGQGAEASHSGDYGELSPHRPGVRGAAAVAKYSRGTGIFSGMPSGARLRGELEYRLGDSR